MGMKKLTIVAVSHASINMDSEISKIITPQTGAVVSFSGTVRGLTTRGGIHRTKAIEYEAYQQMAEEKMQQVAEEIRQRWATIEGIAIVQRIGKLNQGEISTLVACSAAHRDTGVFDAAKYGIDRMKEIVPVWKRELGDGGARWVVGTYHPKPGE